MELKLVRKAPTPTDWVRKPNLLARLEAEKPAPMAYRPPALSVTAREHAMLLRDDPAWAQSPRARTAEPSTEALVKVLRVGSWFSHALPRPAYDISHYNAYELCQDGSVTLCLQESCNWAPSTAKAVRRGTLKWRRVFVDPKALAPEIIGSRVSGRVPNAQSGETWTDHVRRAVLDGANWMRES